MTSIPELFGCLVFNDSAMKQHLSKETYQAFKNAAAREETLPLSIADAIADAMKGWAVGMGATHYTHWFQPMTGLAAEKHDSFITRAQDGTAIMRFSGKELIKGEPDASSFPSGGLRSTFEARGYTAWDTSNYAFIKDGTLCIPSAYISYSGQVLDKKTPLLRSMRALSDQVKRCLKLLGKTPSSINITVGCEQEYFLVDRELFDKRKDLISCGRTLLGARPVKGQELEDHYFGTIKPRVIAYMQELDRELWKLGIFAKTRHNEAAPAQHELAPVFTTVNTATDHNQLTMEVMKKVAAKHNLACLLHEKPFAGVNGSGKHNNWSLSTADGENLLDPGKKPESNLQFLLFLSAVLKGADDHQDLLRLSVATAGNDHRLGAGEAPPAILSIYLGDELTEILESFVNGKTYTHKNAERVQFGIGSIPDFMRDTSDRNRTSPFAFTGNKFEFRMPGSALNVSEPNIMLNAAIADALDVLCTKLEKTGVTDAAVKKLIADTYSAHKRIIFNGNNYSTEWRLEAEKRGLLNLKTTPDALPYLSRNENITLFKRLNIYSASEVESRQEILLENYCKVISIEALTLLSMAVKEVLPAAFKYAGELADNVAKKTALNVSAKAEAELLTKISQLSDKLWAAKLKLEESLTAANKAPDVLAEARAFCELTLLSMQKLRSFCDELETLVSKKLWPFPTYSELLFSV